MAAQGGAAREVGRVGLAEARGRVPDPRCCTVVPSGMLSDEPIISDATFARIAKKNNLSDKSFGPEDLEKLDAKFEKVTASLKRDGVFEKIVAVAKRYGVAPEAVAACIIGEHVFNVTLADRFQSQFVRLYTGWLNKSDSVRDLYLGFLEEGPVREILDGPGPDNEKWDAVFSLYNSKYRNTGDYPNKGFISTFFNPYGAGLTYGLGQLSPVRVLMANDVAVRLGGLPRISPDDMESLYRSTLDVDLNINYVAATVVVEIEAYRRHAKMDISRNIGVLATLFNLGDERRRAKELAKANLARERAGEEMLLPVENFYGWFMNVKEDEIKRLVGRS